MGMLLRHLTFALFFFFFCLSLDSSWADSSFNISRYIKDIPEDIKLGVQTSLKIEEEVRQNGKQKNSCALQEPIPCPPGKYRRPNGECNNIRHPRWGSRGTPFLRYLPPTYADGISKPRHSITNHALPSALDVARSIQNTQIENHESVTALLGAWGEFLLHDLAGTGNLKVSRCCDKSKDQHPECYGKISAEQCREYMRTLPTLEMENCNFEYRNQMNLASAFLDASAVYGSTEAQISKLRTYDAGLVNISSCFSCQTNALYSAILREHNRIAVNLAKLNRHWPDDVIFYEARRIVAAEIQHITYSEFLPIVLGEEAIVNSDLELKSHGRFSKYSSSQKAGIYNAVALGALPALMSLMPVRLMNETVSNFAEMIDMLIKTPAQVPSLHMAINLRSDWDTASLFIHMGRDHGLPGYTTWLNSARNATRKYKFEDLEKMGMKREYVKALKYLYMDPEDVDFLVGAVLEKPMPGAVVGRTLSHLLKQQFILLKIADRFWYENDLPPSSLTTDQLTEIKKTSIAGLLCANTDYLDKIQPKAFFQEDLYLNAKISCDHYSMPQLTPWLEMDHMADLSDDILMDALSKAEQEVLERRKIEFQSWKEGHSADPKSPVGTAASFSKANRAALKLANTSLLFEFASNEIINSLLNHRRKRQVFDNSIFLRDDLSNGLQNVDISSLIAASFLEDPTCDDSGPCDPTTPFRTMTGHCNNIANPSWGKSLTTFSRLLPSVYDDGISRPRVVGATGQPLPSPRIVSSVIHPDISNLHSRYTLITMQFAQFVDHDLTMTPIHKGFHESIPNCRSCDSPRTVHPECNPFPVPPGDHYYPEVNITSGQRLCFPFMRSLPGQQSLGPRQQVNQNTAFLDASQVYGENLCVLKNLKGLRGRMNSTQHPVRGRELLPQSDSHPECKSASGLCFIAGDGRASEQPGLTVIHTLFLREHNRLCEALREINPHWDDEKVFEHARRILIAENQHMTYNEFLPRVLSWNAMNLYGLKLLPQGYYKGYNPKCNPSIVNEFAAAAYRIGHSLLRPHIPRMNQHYQVVDPPILLRDGFFKVDMIMQTGMVDEISRGLISTPMESLDQFITGEVTNHLFEDRKIPFSGIDLVALNVQRARDHGIPSYNNYRALCNLKRATTFDDLSREIPPEVIARLKRIYATVDDIDLFPGGMSERPLQGGLVGPTFACIIAIQFRQLRKCDRFWYENIDPTVRFTEHQLAEIRKSTLAKLICDNMDHPGEIQRAAFDLPSNFLNPRVDCRSLPAINLNAWRESSSNGCIIGDRHVEVGESAFPSPCTSCICNSDGGQCASLRVTDCNQLLREWSREAVMRDEVCTAQCGFFLHRGGVQSSSSANLNAGLIPPPARHLRARQIGRNNFQNFRNDFSPFSGFKFPDLTPFIAK